LEELARLKRPLSSFDGMKHEALERSADKQILDAKIVTAALFLEREGNARKTSFLFDKYIRAIWGHQGQAGYAEKVNQEAEQIWVIGYSFDRHDRKALIELLRKSGDCPIFIQNRTKEEARRICDEELAPRYSDLAFRLRPIGKPF